MRRSRASGRGPFSQLHHIQVSTGIDWHDGNMALLILKASQQGLVQFCEIDLLSFFAWRNGCLEVAPRGQTGLLQIGRHIVIRPWRHGQIGVGPLAINETILDANSVVGHRVAIGKRGEQAPRLNGYFSAAAPPMISLISLVICACRARLYCSDNALIISPAFSVAAFMATRRAICSLTAESRKHLKSRILNDTGKISSRISAALGRNSYSTAVFFSSTTFRPGSGASDDSGSSVSTVGTCFDALRNFM